MPEQLQAPADGVDPNVKVPGAVARAAAQADAFYAAPAPADGAVTPPAQPAPDLTATVIEPQPAAAPAPTPAPAPVEPPKHTPAPTNEQGWEHRYHSMRGRYDQAMTTLQGMQEQMRQMGDELQAAQAALANVGRVAPGTQSNQKLVTDQEREVYGEELLDVVARRAVEAVSPEINNLKAENQQLKRTQAQQQTRNVHQALDGAVPNWRAINRSPRFGQWLSLTDLLSGAPRRNLLNAAFQAADAPRVVAFFKSFVDDEAATGSTEFSLQQPVPAAPAAPRTPPVVIDTLAAPGRAKPVGSSDPRNVTDSKPIFTRAQISQFYDACRRGAYNGREAERTAYEKAIFSAQNEGRVR